ncbi:hypothetical protein [Bradyrhizobium ottawaense]|uniref:hypothetical protein n=1 Tax=Bradyrhizobium ottawaense TaxID=931866 RepID=UPI003FA12354
MKKANKMPVNARKHALILAAWSGLSAAADLNPKPLVQIHGTPILHKALGRVGVEQVTIVVGYRKEAIQGACGSRFGGVAIKHVESPVYDRTGSGWRVTRSFPGTTSFLRATSSSRKCIAAAAYQ